MTLGCLITKRCRSVLLKDVETDILELENLEFKDFSMESEKALERMLKYYRRILKKKKKRKIFNRNFKIQTQKNLRVVKKV